MLIIINENQVARSFRLTVGLIEGYGKDGWRHRPEEVGEIIADWLLSQRKAKRPYLPGSVTTGTMYYHNRESAQLIAEPVALYEGDVSPEYNAELSDGEVLTALQELADVLSGKLKQKRVYLRYNGSIQILERLPR